LQPGLHLGEEPRHPLSRGRRRDLALARPLDGVHHADRDVRLVRLGHLALDLFLFYLFFELCLVPLYVMIGVWGGQARVKAALKFFLYTMAGSMLMLAALLYLAHAFHKLTGHY